MPCCVEFLALRRVHPGHEQQIVGGLDLLLAVVAAAAGGDARPRPSARCRAAPGARRSAPGSGPAARGRPAGSRRVCGGCGRSRSRRRAAAPWRRGPGSPPGPAGSRPSAAGRRRRPAGAGPSPWRGGPAWCRTRRSCRRPAAPGSRSGHGTGRRRRRPGRRRRRRSAAPRWTRVLGRRVARSMASAGTTSYTPRPVAGSQWPNSSTKPSRTLCSWRSPSLAACLSISSSSKSALGERPSFSSSFRSSWYSQLAATTRSLAE